MWKTSYRNSLQIKKKLFVLLLVVLLHTSLITSGQNIVINEVVASNSTTILDEDKNSRDWIELYNKEDSTANIASFGLSDDKIQPLIESIHTSLLITYGPYGSIPDDAIGPQVTAGMYLYQLLTRNIQQTRKLFLCKSKMKGLNCNILFINSF